MLRVANTSLKQFVLNIRIIFLKIFYKNKGNMLSKMYLVL